jgi:hypothetical protein
MALALKRAIGAVIPATPAHFRNALLLVIANILTPDGIIPAV